MQVYSGSRSRDTLSALKLPPRPFSTTLRYLRMSHPPVSKFTSHLVHFRSYQIHHASQIDPQKLQAPRKRCSLNTHHKPYSPRPPHAVEHKAPRLANYPGRLMFHHLRSYRNAETLVSSKTARAAIDRRSEAAHLKNASRIDRARTYYYCMPEVARAMAPVLHALALEIPASAPAAASMSP